MPIREMVSRYWRSAAGAFAGLALFGAVLLVPALEELFWRGWLMRWFIRPDFEAVRLGTYTRYSFWVTAGLFAAEHGSYWDVGLLAGIIYNWWMIRTGRLAHCIVAHAVTNGLLAAYVLSSGRVVHRITGNRRAQVRGIGWEFVHVAVDDASRLAYVEVRPDESGGTATQFLWRAWAWFRRHGIRVRRVLTDNGSGYRAARFARLCRRTGVRHLRTRPCTPRTNGNAERFIQTHLREWAYRRAYPTSRHRTEALPAWLYYYNWARGHGALHGRPPITRLTAPNNLVAVQT